jgi:predicted metalloprotease
VSDQAAAVGDDRILRQTTGRIDRESMDAQLVGPAA